MYYCIGNSSWRQWRSSITYGYDTIVQYIMLIRNSYREYNITLTRNNEKTRYFNFDTRLFPLLQLLINTYLSYFF